MNEDNLDACSTFVNKCYIDQAKANLRNLQKRFHHIILQRKLPEEGFSDLEIQSILHEISLMDSNNFSHAVGAGEREGRMFSPLVQHRHSWMSHGIGRSGDILALQPKAAGSSLISKLANALVLDVIRMNGVSTCKEAFIIPMATGMSLSLCFLTLRSRQPNAKYVIWPRIDQKSCIKSIYTAGYTALVVEPLLVGDELQTNLAEIEGLINEYGEEQILCVMTTTSCFAPRVPDNLVKVGKICAQRDIPHIVNNAYGVMLPRCMNLIQEAHRQGRVDLFVQSTDKNFLVPVGGAIIAGFDETLLHSVAQAYPGRGSSTPSVDVFLTLLSLGRQGIRNLMEQREQCYQELHKQLSVLAKSLGERVLETPHNPISLAMTLTESNYRKEVSTSDNEMQNTLSDNPTSSSPQVTNKTKGHALTALGSQLFTRKCTGARVVLAAADSSARRSTIQGHEFLAFGSHSNVSTENYINIAAAIGQTLEEVNQIIKLLKKVFPRNE